MLNYVNDMLLNKVYVKVIKDVARFGRRINVGHVKTVSATTFVRS